MPRIAACLCLLLLLAPAAASAAGRGATARALGAQMRSAGPSSGALAVDLDTGRTIYRLRAQTPRMPASVEKLYTAATALRRLGADGRLTTTVLAEAEPDAGGVVRGDLYLRGGGDPDLDVADLGALADQVADAGITGITGRVIGDEFAWDTRRGGPSSGFALDGDVGGVLSALVIDRGRTGRSAPYWQPRPAEFTASGFARQLRHLGVDVPADARRGRTPADAVPVAAWRSRPMREVVAHMNQPSDNFLAEMLVKAIAAAEGRRGTTAAGTREMEEELGELGIEPQIVDGSGLSRSDRTSPEQVVTLLEALAADPVFEASLAVAGRSGTLAYRMRSSAARGRCRAKTGTLRDVSALAGYCTTRSGDQVAFAFLMNYVSPYSARILQDHMTGALARYSG